MDEKELQWAVDELKIRNVMAQLALLSDLGDIEDWGNLFAEDGVYLLRGVPAQRGRVEIVAAGQDRRNRGTHGPGSGNRHISASVVVRSTGADTADAESYLQMYRDVDDLDDDGQPVKSAKLMVIGYYRDSFVRVGTDWKVASRDLVTSSYTPEWRHAMKTLYGRD